MTRRTLTVCNGCDRVLATDEPYIGVIFLPGMEAAQAGFPPSGDYCKERPCQDKLNKLVADLSGHFEVRMRPERVYG